VGIINKLFDKSRDKTALPILAKSFRLQRNRVLVHHNDRYILSLFYQRLFAPVLVVAFG
jgi:hypothetical protein